MKIVETHLVRCGGRQFLELPHQVVCEVTHATPQKRGQVFQCDGPETPRDLPELLQRLAGSLDRLAKLFEGERVTLATHDHEGIPSDEGVTRQALASLHTLQEEHTAAAVCHTEKGRRGGEQVSQDILVDRYHRAAHCQLFHFSQQRSDHL